MEIGLSLKEARKRQGLTQKQLADMLGVATITIQQYEGNKRQPSLEQLKKIADALSVTVNAPFVGNIKYDDKPDPRWQELLEKVKNGTATPDEKREFGLIFSNSAVKLQRTLDKLHAAQQKILERIGALEGSPETVAFKKEATARIKSEYDGRMKITIQKGAETATYAISALNYDHMKNILDHLDNGWEIIDEDAYDAEMWIEGEPDGQHNTP